MSILPTEIQPPPGRRVDLSNSKLIGIIGAILHFFIPVIGVVLLAIAIYQLSRKLNRPSIWRNYLYHLVFGIVAYAAIILFIVGAVFSHAASSDPIRVLAGIAGGIIIGLILLLIALILLRRSYNELADVLKVSLFRTTADIYLVGIVLLLVGFITLIILVGAVVILIAMIIVLIAFVLQVVAFAEIPREVTVQQPSIPTST